MLPNHFSTRFLVLSTVGILSLVAPASIFYWTWVFYQAFIDFDLAIASSSNGQVLSTGIRHVLRDGGWSYSPLRQLFRLDVNSNWYYAAVFIHFWLALEVIHWLHAKFVAHPLAKATPVSKECNTIGPDKRPSLLLQMLDEITNGDEWLGSWFLYVDSNEPVGKDYVEQEVYRNNLREWLTWAFLDKEMYELDKDEYEEMTEITIAAIKKFNVTLRNGYNARIKSIRLTFDPVKILYRPLVFYCVINVLDAFKDFVLYMAGFRFLQKRHHSYWYYNPNDSALHSRLYNMAFGRWHRATEHDAIHRVEQPNPIVFIHGLGVGLFPYTKFVLKMVLTNPRRPVLLVNLPHIAMKSFSHIPNIQESTSDIASTLISLKFASATFVGHSLGTVFVANILRENPSVVSSVVLMEPVCFHLFNARLPYSFLHKKPERAAEYLIYYLCATEKGISSYISRRFYWHRNMLSPASLPSSHRVIFAGKDSLVNAPEQHEWLISRGVSSELLDGLEHAEALLWNNLEDKVVAAVNQVWQETTFSSLSGREYKVHYEKTRRQNSNKCFKESSVQQDLVSRRRSSHSQCQCHH